MKYVALALLNFLCSNGYEAFVYQNDDLMSLDGNKWLKAQIDCYISSNFSVSVKEKALTQMKQVEEEKGVLCTCIL